MSKPSLGVMYRRELAPENLVTMCRLIEVSGVDELWIVEDMSFAGGVASAATALQVTERIRVALGILPVPVRNPLFTAMEIATLCRLHPGRLTAGVGHGMLDWMASIGSKPASPMRAFEEITSAIVRLLDGEEVTFDGDYVHLENASLSYPPDVRPDLVAGVRGPKSLALAGKILDGVLLPEPVSAHYVAFARKIIDEAAASAGRDRPRLTTYCWYSLEESADKARDSIRPLLVGGPGGLSEPSVRGSLELLPFGGELLQLLDSDKSQSEIEARIPDEWIDQLSISGTADDCANAILRLHEAGADCVVLVPDADRAAPLVRAIGDSLIPALNRITV